MTLALFWQVQNHQFINYDDPSYVTENRHVQTGLTPESVLWAFTSTEEANWHPLTWLSHMVDVELYGLNPEGHHLTNLLFHVMNTLLLFWVLNRMTKAVWQSAFVAALFAVHPLHVESAAWVAERKDVLSGFFWMLAMGAYVLYTERPTFKRYLPVLLFFALGLMAKPMLVTLPFVLLLLDYWPLGRIRWSSVREKIPLFILTILSSVGAYYAQEKGEALRSVEQFPLDVRIENALVSYIRYIIKMIWPSDLSIFYPHPGSGLPAWGIGGAALLLAGVSLFVFLRTRAKPHLAVGWLWYLGVLVPVIGLVQVGSQAMADRYTYLPLIGLFIMIAWGASDVAAKGRSGKVALPILAVLLISAASIRTMFHLRHWTDNIALYEHALEVDPENYRAHHGLGVFYGEQGRFDEAITHIRTSIQLQPNNPEIYNHLGMSLAGLERSEEAIQAYRTAIKLQPNFPAAYFNLGNAYKRQKRMTEAVQAYQTALKLQPDFIDVRSSIGTLYKELGRLEEAIEEFQAALKLRPDSADAHNNLGAAYATKGLLDEALEEFHISLKINPNQVEAHMNIGSILRQKGNMNQAREEFKKVLEVKPDFPPARQALESLTE